MATYEVEVAIRPWEDGGYIAEAVGLRGCWAVADTLSQILKDLELRRDELQASLSIAADRPPQAATL